MSDEWPPKALAPILDLQRVWQAWYSGDPTALGRAYSSGSAIRPSQQATGFVGRVARWWWGQPDTGNQSRPKVHIPVAADIAEASGDLLFGEELQLAPPGNEDLTRLGEVLDANNWQSLLPEAAELAAAHGGVYLRVAWDSDVADYPLIEAIDADHADPTFRYGRLAKVRFWQTVREEGSTIWRHLETHEPGRITHALYRGTADSLGTVVPLADDPTTAGLEVNAEAAILTGINQLTAVYVPNVKPSRLWRHHPVGRNLGRSDFSGVEPLFDMIDEAWASWMRDLRIGKARIMVPDAALETLGPGKGATFDIDREVFVGLRLPPSDTVQQVVAQQFQIRTEEHAKTVEALLRQAYLSAGYSPATFGLTDDVGVTATEVAARERKTMTTREKKSRYWTPRLEDLFEVVTALDAAVFHQGVAVRPRVTFPAAVTPTPGEVAQSVQMLNAAQAASVETRVRMVHPDWDDKAVQDETARIRSEQAMDTTSVTISDPAGQQEAATPELDAAALKAKYDALGIAVRAGVKPEDAARALGLDVGFTGAVPVALRLPEQAAATLEPASP